MRRAIIPHDKNIALPQLIQKHRGANGKNKFRRYLNGLKFFNDPPESRETRCRIEADSQIFLQNLPHVKRKLKGRESADVILSFSKDFSFVRARAYERERERRVDNFSPRHP